MAQVEASLAGVPWPYPRLFLQPPRASSLWSLRLIAWGLGPEDVVAAAHERPLPAAPPTSSMPSPAAGAFMPSPPPLRPLSSTAGGGGGAGGGSFLSRPPSNTAHHHPHHAPTLAGSSSSMRHGGAGAAAPSGALSMGQGDEEEAALLEVVQGQPAGFAVAGVIKGLPRAALAVAHVKLTATVLKQGDGVDDDEEEGEGEDHRANGAVGGRAKRWGGSGGGGSRTSGGSSNGGRRRRRSSGAAASAAAADAGSSGASFYYREVLAVPLCPEDGSVPAAIFKLPAHALPRPGEYPLLVEAALVDGGGRAWVVPQGARKGQGEEEGRLLATLVCVPTPSSS